MGEMSITIKDHIDYVAEAIALLCHMGQGKSYHQLRIDLETKYVFKFKKELPKFELLEKIEKRAGVVLKKYQEDLQYYFGSDDDSKTDCVGRLVLLWEEWCGYSFSNTKEYSQYLDQLTEQEYCEKFSYALQGYNNAVRDISTDVTYSTPIEIIEFIMKMDADESDKWKVQTVFLARKEHQKKALSLIDMAIKVLKEYAAELEKIGGEFKTYWSEILGDKPFRDYVADKLSVKLDENPLGYTLRPSFIACNMMGVHADSNDDGTYKSPDRAVLGIIFSDEFDLRTNVTNDDKAFDNYAFSVLKLLSDKSKFEILSYTKEKPAYGSELAKHLNLTTATISHHMTGLVTAGLVEMKKEENRIYYLANKKVLGDVLDYCRRVLVEDDKQ